MDRVQKKSEQLSAKLKKAVQKADTRKKAVSDLEEGVNLLEKESKKFDEETKKLQKEFIKRLFIALTAFTIIVILIIITILIFK